MNVLGYWHSVVNSALVDRDRIGSNLDHLV